MNSTRFARALVALALLQLCGCDRSHVDAAVPRACFAMRSGTCVDLPIAGDETAHQRGSCDAAGGVFQFDPCPRDGLVASCALPSGRGIQHFYVDGPLPTAELVRSHCASVLLGEALATSPDTTKEQP